GRLLRRRLQPGEHRQLDEPAAREAAGCRRDRLRRPVQQRGDGHDAQPRRHPDGAGGQGGGGGMSVASRPLAHVAAQRYDPCPPTAGRRARLGGRRYVEADVTDLDLARYTAAWRHVIDRHDAMRTVVTGDRQRVLPDVPEYEVAVTDLRAGGDEERERRL